MIAAPGRPRLRGRIAFGGVVHWGEMWTPGANVVFVIDRSGRATSFSMKGIEQRFWMRGIRVQE